MIKNFSFQAPVRVIFGLGSLKALEQECKSFGTEKILVVTDENIAKTPAFSTVMDILQKSKIKFTTFADVIPDPDEECVDKGLKMLRTEGCQALIGFGGGSSMDTAKAISILAKNPGPVTQYDGVKNFTEPALPIIAIPTTAGTGSEVSPGAMVTSHKDKRKYNVRGIYNKVAVLDPTVLTAVPKTVAASTGMDAFTHAVESYISRLSSPMSEMYSKMSLSLVASSIREFVANREDLEAGANMLLASMLAAVAMGNARLGVAHSISSALGARFHFVHGVGCAIPLPACLESMVDAVPAKFAFIARTMEPKLRSANDSECARALPGIFSKLVSDLGIETKLANLGIKEGDLEPIAGDVMTNKVTAISPRDFTLEDIMMILRRAL